MKKILLKTVFAFLSLSLLLSASWEGSSAIAPEGELPERGFYVSSNSFPINTVVDIVNLETGRTIQAIVRTSQNAPGGIVLLSRDAADALGISNRSNGRIRLNPPPEAIAFSRFTDGRSFSGDPDYDTRAFVRENALTRRGNTVYPRDSFSQDAPYSQPVPKIQQEETPDISKSAVPSIISAPPTPVSPVVIVMPPPGPPAAASAPAAAEPNLPKAIESAQTAPPSTILEIPSPKPLQSGAEVIVALPNPQERPVIPVETGGTAAPGQTTEPAQPRPVAPAPDVIALLPNPVEQAVVPDTQPSSKPQVVQEAPVPDSNTYSQALNSQHPELSPVPVNPISTTLLFNPDQPRLEEPKALEDSNPSKPDVSPAVNAAQPDDGGFVNDNILGPQSPPQNGAAGIATATPQQNAYTAPETYSPPPSPRTPEVTLRPDSPAVSAAQPDDGGFINDNILGPQTGAAGITAMGASEDPQSVSPTDPLSYSSINHIPDYPQLTYANPDESRSADFDGVDKEYGTHTASPSSFPEAYETPTSPPAQDFNLGDDYPFVSQAQAEEQNYATQSPQIPAHPPVGGLNEKIAPESSGLRDMPETYAGPLYPRNADVVLETEPPITSAKSAEYEAAASETAQEPPPQQPQAPETAFAPNQPDYLNRSWSDGADLQTSPYNETPQFTDSSLNPASGDLGFTPDQPQLTYAQPGLSGTDAEQVPVYENQERETKTDGDISQSVPDVSFATTNPLYNERIPPIEEKPDAGITDLAEKSYSDSDLPQIASGSPEPLYSEMRFDPSSPTPIGSAAPQAREPIPSQSTPQNATAGIQEDLPIANVAEKEYAQDAPFALHSPEEETGASLSAPEIDLAQSDETVFAKETAPYRAPVPEYRFENAEATDFNGLWNKELEDSALKEAPFTISNTNGETLNPEASALEERNLPSEIAKEAAPASNNGFMPEYSNSPEPPPDGFNGVPGAPSWIPPQDIEKVKQDALSAENLGRNDSPQDVFPTSEPYENAFSMTQPQFNEKAAPSYPYMEPSLNEEGGVSTEPLYDWNDGRTAASSPTLTQNEIPAPAVPDADIAKQTGTSEKSFESPPEEIQPAIFPYGEDSANLSQPGTGDLLQKNTADATEAVFGKEGAYTSLFEPRANITDKPPASVYENPAAVSGAYDGPQVMTPANPGAETADSYLLEPEKTNSEQA
ncbi:MAG: hypothetical protein LBC53_04325, partial [Spirochaetaceae bacterium]|nr:hypothetical protein [Spirochaetaceae bacterium]